MSRKISLTPHDSSLLLGTMWILMWSIMRPERNEIRRFSVQLEDWVTQKLNGLLNFGLVRMHLPFSQCLNMGASQGSHIASRGNAESARHANGGSVSDRDDGRWMAASVKEYEQDLPLEEDKARPGNGGCAESILDDAVGTPQSVKNGADDGFFSSPALGVWEDGSSRGKIPRNLNMYQLLMVLLTAEHSEEELDNEKLEGLGEIYNGVH
ncbi:hypothetical protein B0H13DRAFT_1908524 [Mycena leptocephala]|nr:hypothetical protein B0H13DRAFT_1908524 [Mycena leptocephala]